MLCYNEDLQGKGIVCLNILLQVIPLYLIGGTALSCSFVWLKSHNPPIKLWLTFGGCSFKPYRDWDNKYMNINQWLKQQHGLNVSHKCE